MTKELQNTKKLTEDTKEEHEKSKTVTDILEEICPCLKCDHEGEREKRVECRRKCTEFVAWKLSMQAIREKKKEDKNKFYSETKLKYYRRKAMNKKFGRKR